MVTKRLHQRWKPAGICLKTDVKLLQNPWKLPGISWHVMKAWQNVAKTLGKPLWIHSKLLASAKSTGIVPKKCWRSACTRGENLPNFASKRMSNCCKTHEISLEPAGKPWKCFKMSRKLLVNFWNAFKIAGLCQTHWNCTQKGWRRPHTRGENLLEFASKRWTNCCKIREICLEFAGMSWKRGKMTRKRSVNVSGCI